MADIKENEMTSKSSVALTDKLRLVGASDNASYNAVINDIAKAIIQNYTGLSLAGSNQSIKAALDSLNSNMNAPNGGMPIRKAGYIAVGDSVSFEINSNLSSHEGFALVALNLGGNAISGTALFFLGRGVSKKKDLLGSMDPSMYSISFADSNWTITNNAASNMYYSVIQTK